MPFTNYESASENTAIISRQQSHRTSAKCIASDFEDGGLQTRLIWRRHKTLTEQ